MANYVPLDEGVYTPPSIIHRAVRRIETAVTCNWFSIAVVCAMRGHQWRSYRPTRCVTVTDCARCGNFRGVSIGDAATCRWYRRGGVV